MLGPLNDARLFGDEIQQAIAFWNRSRLAPCAPGQLSLETIHWDIEARFLKALISKVADDASKAPGDPARFVDWFQGLIISGPGQGHPLFPWIAKKASLNELRWFFRQEAAGEAGFDDLVALTQIRMPNQPKLELARNFWDEMGRGNEQGMHGPMLTHLAHVLDVEPRIETTVAESLMLANAMTAMATRRDYAWHSIGALGVIELTAPGRATFVSNSLRRLGISGKDRHYFDLHAVLDVKHSTAWNSEVIAPLVQEDHSRARFIAEGALVRLWCGARCFDRYARELGIGQGVLAKPASAAA